MIPGLLFFFSPYAAIALLIWAVAVLLILFDLYKMRQKRQRGEHSFWYERPVLWFAACGFPFGLILLIGLLPFSLAGYVMLGSIILFLPPFAIGLIAVLRLDAKKTALEQEAHLRQLAASSPGTLARSQPLTNQAIVGMIGVAASLMIFTPWYLILHLSPFGAWMWQLTAILTISVGVFIRSRVLQSSVKRINQQRMALAAAFRRPVVFEPISSEPGQPLMPPLVLHLKRAIVCCYLVLVAAFTISYLFLINAGDWGFIIFLDLWYTCLWMFLLLRSLRERVEATTQGLRVVRGAWFCRWKQQMPWQEARLFTCYKMPGFFGGKTTMTYELSSAGRVVQWTRVIETRSPFTFWQAEVPTDEYNRQTQELCACITRQTGLQLHDLSEEASNAREQEMTMVQSYE